MKAVLIDTMGDDMRVCDAARTSFHKTSKEYTEEQNHKLIQYLAEHKHYSPFGHCFASFHVKAPIFVARQLVKHKFLRWNEVSRRYVDDEPDFFEPFAWRRKSKDKKQGSEGVHTMEYSTELDKGISLREWKYTLEEDALQLYNVMIEQGVAPEQARMILPQSTNTEWYWSGSLDAFADMCKLRLKKDTQEETRHIANQISTQMQSKFPVSWKALIGGNND